MPANTLEQQDQHDDSYYNTDPNPSFIPNSPINISTAATASAAGVPPRQPLPKLKPKLFSFLLKAIIMFFVISFFLLFLGIAALAVLHLFLPGGLLYRRRFRRYSSTADCDAGYSPEDLQRCLPRFDYTVKMAADDCAVCLEGFNEGESCRSLPVCRHVFHAGCVDRWLTRVANCPICRTRIRLDSAGGGSATGGDDSKLLLAVEV